MSALQFQRVKHSIEGRRRVQVERPKLTSGSSLGVLAELAQLLKFKFRKRDRPIVREKKLRWEGQIFGVPIPRNILSLSRLVLVLVLVLMDRLLALRRSRNRHGVDGASS